MADLGTCTAFIFSAVSLCKCTCTHLLSFRSVLWPPLHYRCSQFLWIFFAISFFSSHNWRHLRIHEIEAALKTYILKIYLYIKLGLYPCVACLYIYTNWLKVCVCLVGTFHQKWNCTNLCSRIDIGLNKRFQARNCLHLTCVCTQSPCPTEDSPG